MREFYLFSQVERRTIERIKTPLLIYQVIEDQITLLLLSDGTASLFNKTREEFYQFFKNEKEKIVISKERQSFFQMLIHASNNIGTTFSIDFSVILNNNETLKIKATIEAEKTENGIILCYTSFFKLGEEKNNEQSINLNIEETEKTKIGKTYLSAFQKTFLNNRFFYWIYDIKHKQLINGNCFEGLADTLEISQNYPQILFDLKIIADEDQTKYLELLNRSISGELMVEGNIKIYNSKFNEYFLQHVLFQSILDTNGEVALSIGTSERLSSYNEFNTNTRKILYENGLITWSYLIKEKKYSFDKLIEGSTEAVENVGLILDAINIGSINMNIDNILDENNSSYQLVKLTDRTGNLKVFEINTSIIRDKFLVPYSIIAIARDVTKFHRKEKDYIEKLEKANVNKSNFLSRLSHDLRTPLGAITSLATFGLEESKEAGSKEYFSKINENSEYVLSFISDILETRLIEKDNFKIDNKVLSLSDFFKHIYSIMEIRTNEKNITLYFNPEIFTNELYLYCDKRKLKQVTINLLSNAVKYTQYGGRITLDVKKSFVDNVVKLVFILSDNGIGMSKEFQQQMYTQYTQEHNRLSFEEEGTGIGLSIVKKIMDNIVGGELLCESELGKGTTFTVKFTSYIATKEQINSSSCSINTKDLNSLKNKNILLCEDKAINVMIVEKILSSIGINLDIAENGKIGLEKIKNNSYDAILMDIRMPEMDGLTAAKEVRKFNKEIPIIALSANAYSEDIKKSIESGMNAHIAKPINREELFTTLCKYIN
ncbi:MAG: response regulator, partial [Spirochaetaceae bacterium]|nr:response regulator [Spirochaetaceae bacterium]